jgi:hypothetical protein
VERSHDGHLRIFDDDDRQHTFMEKAATSLNLLSERRRTGLGVGDHRHQPKARGLTAAAADERRGLVDCFDNTASAARG